uniref:Uncharacterized protein n=1 Tax=Trypanosoma vivax (strain Y486) TaxID=1055687 RepID=G0UB14_TRYVY|nr:hypothetical protein TVY486_1104850 [Trypanosoma vivax Y486]
MPSHWADSSLSRNFAFLFFLIPYFCCGSYAHFGLSAARVPSKEPSAPLLHARLRFPQEVADLKSVFCSRVLASFFPLLTVFHYFRHFCIIWVLILIFSTAYPFLSPNFDFENTYPNNAPDFP